jgi:outer membrane lipoprotein SlyB
MIKSYRLKSFFLCVLIISSLFSSCQSRTGTGVLAGGALGAGVGGIAGGGSGALIGGAAGVIAGGLIGAALDEQDRAVMQKRSPSTVVRMDEGKPLTVDDVIELHKGGVSDDTIINYIDESGTVYQLSQSQIRRMQRAGVSQRLINHMLETGL